MNTRLENELFYLQLLIKSQETRLAESRARESELISEIEANKDVLEKDDYVEKHFKKQG